MELQEFLSMYLNLFFSKFVFSPQFPLKECIKFPFAAPYFIFFYAKFSTLERFSRCSKFFRMFVCCHRRNLIFSNETSMFTIIFIFPSVCSISAFIKLPFINRKISLYNVLYWRVKISIPRNP